MNGYTHDTILTAPFRDTWRLAQDLVDAVREPVPGTYRCHEVARAVLAALIRMTESGKTMRVRENDTHDPRPGCISVEVVDGVYAKHVAHTWLLLKTGKDSSWQTMLLDTYAVGRVPLVQLVDLGFPLSAHAKLYKRQDNAVRPPVMSGVVAELTQQMLAGVKCR